MALRLEPDVGRYLLDQEGEMLVDEVHRHWVTRAGAVGIILLGAIVLGTTPGLRKVWLLPFGLGLGLIIHGVYRILLEINDRFVVTNMRVFRVHGVLNRHLAIIPIARILDTSVEQPLFGMLLNYGHFVFESAAQEQGLRVIKFVPDIERHDRIIQTIIARSGVRARADISSAELDGA